MRNSGLKSDIQLLKNLRVTSQILFTFWYFLASQINKDSLWSHSWSLRKNVGFIQAFSNIHTMSSFVAIIKSFDLFMWKHNFYLNLAETNKTLSYSMSWNIEHKDFSALCSNKREKSFNWKVVMEKFHQRWKLWNSFSGNLIWWQCLFINEKDVDKKVHNW